MTPDGCFAGDTVQHAIWTDENGVPKIPEASGAVTYNLTAVQTGGNGFLAIFPGGSEWGGISSINWTVSNADIANGGTVAPGPAQLTGPGSVHVRCGGFAAAVLRHRRHRLLPRSGLNRLRHGPRVSAARDGT